MRKQGARTRQSGAKRLITPGGLLTPTAHWTANSYKRHSEFDDTTYIAIIITTCVRGATQDKLIHVHGTRRAVTNTKKGHTKQRTPITVTQLNQRS